MKLECGYFADGKIKKAAGEVRVRVEAAQLGGSKEAKFLEATMVASHQPRLPVALACFPLLHVLVELAGSG
jgi:hypothetical protein